MNKEERKSIYLKGRGSDMDDLSTYQLNRKRSDGFLFKRIIKLFEISFLCGIFFLNIWPAYSQENENFDYKGFQPAKQGEEIPNFPMVIEYLSIMNKTELSPASIYQVHLEPTTQQYDFMILLVHDLSASIYGFTNNYQEVDLLATFSNATINDVKIVICEKENQIHLWSQAPFSAMEQEVVLEWDGNNLIEKLRKHSDPTLEVLELQKRYIEIGEWDKVAIPEELDLQYPNFYSDFNRMGIYALQTAHQIALEKYKNKSLSEAVEAMEWGIHFYFNAYPYSKTHSEIIFNLQNIENISVEDLANFYLTPIESLSLEEIALYLNDYAFFLSEIDQNQKAEPILQKVIEFNPNRVVVYINIGDVCWNLGEQEKAREYYQKYVELLGADNPRIPARVKERISMKN